MPPESSSDSLYGFRRRALWLVWIGLAFAFVWYAWELVLLAFAGFLLAIILRTFSTGLQNIRVWGRELRMLRLSPRSWCSSA